MEIIKEIKETFGNLEHLTPDRIRSLIRNTLDFFKVLKEQMNSGDPALREEALAKAIQLRDLLKTEMENLSHLFYSNPDKLVSLMKNMPALSEKDQDVLGEIRKDLQDYRSQIMPTNPPKKPKKNAKRIKLAC